MGNTRLGRAVALFNARRFDEAARLLERVQGAGHLLSQARLCARGSPGGLRIEEALDAPVAPELPPAARARFLRAYVLYRSDRHAEALRLMRGFGRLRRDLGWMRHLRGKVLLHGPADHRGAQREFAAALRALPSLWPARAYWAEAALCRGDRAGAFKAFDDLVKELHGSARAQALAWRGAARLWTGEWRAARRDLDRAVRAGCLFGLCWRGAALLKLGRVKEAERDLRAALAHHPDDAEANTWLAELLWRKGRPREALTPLRRALALEKDPPWALAVRDAISGTADGRLLSLSGVRRSHRHLRPLWPAGTRSRR